jgi:hypothetical protein
MYSPKIREDLIPKIYQVAKVKKVKMTTLVNQILEKVLNDGGEAEHDKYGIANAVTRAAQSEENSEKGIEIERVGETDYSCTEGA